ncbi:PilZ domain-containing protein [bacterium]|nr:MAG: PilZ domain-containing protein [bacterium]
MADKREAKRKIKRLPVTFSCKTEEYTGISSNFSTSGIFIRTRKNFNIGLPVNVVLELDENSKIPISGVISRAKTKTKFETTNCGIGVQLTEAPEAYKDFLEVLYKNEL